MIIQVEETEFNEALDLFKILGYRWDANIYPPLFIPTRIFVEIGHSVMRYTYSNPDPGSTLTFSEFSTKQLISIL